MSPARRWHPVRWGARLLPAGLCAAGCALAQASSPSQPQVAAGAFVVHRVAPGDSAASLAAHFLRTPRQWPVLLRNNGLTEAQALTPGRMLHIPTRWLGPVALQARVDGVRGEPVAIMAQAQPQPSAPLRVGDMVAEGTRLQVPEDGELRLRLADGSVVRVLAGSDLTLRRQRLREHGGPVESVLRIRRGGVEADVSKQPATRIFEIEAPGAVASVRGTRFGMAVAHDGRVTTAVTQGEVTVRKTGDEADAASAAIRVRAGQRLVTPAASAGADAVPDQQGAARH